MTLAGDLSLFAKTIAEDTEHGASHILKIAVSSLQTALKRNPKTSPEDIRMLVKEYALKLVSSQRHMASILNFSNRLLNELGERESDKDIEKRILDFASVISKESSDALVQISNKSSAEISGSKFMTHSRSSTLLNFLSQSRNRKGLKIYSTFSRPGGEGRLLSGELSVAGIYSELIEDAEAMKYLPECDALLIGADAIIPKGIVNKIGTYMLCLSAQEMRVPVYCLTDSMKLWPFNEPIKKSLRSKGARLVSGIDLFEITPGALVTKIIFETGPIGFRDIRFEANAASIAPEIKQHLKA